MDLGDRDSNVISITKEETRSGHVDDMLQRQRNMRGEAGIRRSDSRSWYYQNWFIFMIVCGVGALISWAVFEPYMHDMPYFQGKMSAVQWYDQPQIVHFPSLGSDAPIFGEFKIRDNKLYIAGGIRRFEHETPTDDLEREDIVNDRLVGVYIEEAIRNVDGQNTMQLGGDAVVPVALLLDTSPPESMAAEGARDLETYRQHEAVTNYAYFAIIAGIIGLFLGAADGIICRLFRRAVLCGFVGLIVGLLGGFISGFIANLIFGPLSRLAMQTEGAGGQAILVAGRALAWAIAGMTMGLGQGVALRSKKLVLYGLIGGIIGGLLGGLLFDPFTWMSRNPTSAHLSRLVGVLVVGMAVGLMIGIVELLARDAWLRMTQGPLAGKEFLVFKDVMYVGASPRSDIYLFNDDLVADTHATLRSGGDICEIEAASRDHELFVNDRSVKRARLRPGDQITIGKTMFTYQERKR